MGITAYIKGIYILAQLLIPHCEFPIPPFYKGQYALSEICGLPQSGSFPFFRVSTFDVCAIGQV